ncbi:MAG: hypothetical protein FWB73_00970 [Treponema sp.]|nr:hypothetical protein [Treponema sp.]
MKKIKINQITGIFGIVVISILMLNCIDNPQFHGQNDMAVVSFSIGERSARTVFPQVSLEQNVDRYVLLGEKTDTPAQEIQCPIEKNNPEVILKLTPGKWNFKLEAYADEYDDDGHIAGGGDSLLILEGKRINVDIKLTELNQVRFTLSPISSISGTGNVEITINCPNTITSYEVKCDGEAWDDDTVQNGTFTYNDFSVPSGEYFYSFQLFENSTPRFTVSELVIVRDNLTSRKTISIQMDGSGNIIPAPTITTPSLPNGTTNVQYNQTLTASGSTPITWSLANGSLPGGLAIAANGTISGTPNPAAATTGKFDFTVQATNAGGSTTRQLSISINRARDDQSYYYPGTGNTYHGFVGTEGITTTSRGITITYPAERTFSTDAFFIMEGTVTSTKEEVKNHALIRVIKNSDTSLVTNYIVKDTFKQRIWLRFGPGEYTVTVCDLASATINSFGLVRSYSYWNSLPFNVTNTRNETTTPVSGDPVTDMRYSYPSYIIQSDDPEITRLVASITAGKTSDLDKITALHDYLVKYTEYDRSSMSTSGFDRKKQDASYVLGYKYIPNQTIPVSGPKSESSFTYNNNPHSPENGHYWAVCEGYANAYAALLRAAGIRTRYVVSTPMNHAWNHVLLNNTWRFIDATWNDTNRGPHDDGVRRTYFLTDTLNGYNNSHTEGIEGSGRSLANYVYVPGKQPGVPKGWY